MAGKKAKLKEVSVTAETPRCIGYADYFLGTSLSVVVKNDGGEAVPVEVTLEGEGLVPFVKSVEVPFESRVVLTAEGVLSPVFFAELTEPRPCSVTACVRSEGKELCRAEAEFTALPFDWWEGLSGNAERLAAFVRPRLSDCSYLLSEAGKRLKKWKEESEFYGYTGADKNAVRRVLAAVFGALKGCSFEEDGKTDCTAPLSCAREGVRKEGKATALELAVLACGCLEAAHLHPVLAVGKHAVGVGVWLYDSCFLDPVTDDCGIVLTYTGEGINNLSFFDADDLFEDSSAAFTPSEGHFRQKLKEGYYECFVDVRRCRLGGVRACPVRAKGIHGYEIYREEEMSEERAPAPLPLFKRLSLDGKQPKNKQWERRLLDLTGKNALLNFSGKHAVHIASADPDALFARLGQGDELRLRPSAEAAPPFGGEYSAQQKELILLEQSKGFLRALDENKQAAETAMRLMRKGREADEESGAKILYLALGFLGYVCKEDKSLRYAPLVLVPAELKRAKGNEDFSVRSSSGEYFVNSTLLEYLKQEFNIDVRGLGGDISALKISEIFAMVRAETAGMKGWQVVSDAYLSVFSFQRFLMWNDIRRNIGEFKKNKLVAALLGGKAETAVAEAAEEDEADPLDVLLPLPSDSSQYSAVSLSAAGASFVLHGPPGTGKSQTIANIIANALAQDKRVLFVAEKKAALDVVKKRLDSVGIGDFCLELHSNKADKGEVLKKLEGTLHLKREEESGAFEECARELVSLRKELLAPMLALHKKRRPGISVYEAILAYLRNKNAPDVLDVESSFYDTLTEEKLAACRNMLLSAAAAASECGGVYNSPFANVNLTEYSQELRDRIFCACEVLLEEIRHLKSFLGLFLEFYRQRVSALSVRKLRALSDLARSLFEGKYQRYFAGCDEQAFYLFYNANRRLDSCLEYYYKHFRTLVEPDRDSGELARFVEQGGDWHLSSAAKTAVKRLNRAALHPIDEEDIPKFLQTLVEIYGAMERIGTNTSLSKAFCDRAGRINFKRRSEFLSDLYRLHETCAGVFLDYNPDAFNGMCIRAANGYTAPVLAGYLKATESYFSAQESFLAITNADRSKPTGEDVLDYFSAKASALIDNIDMLPNWCMYRATAQKLGALGLNFIADALESGRLKAENVLAGFEKNVYKNFLEINIPADEALSRLTVGTLEDTIEKFRLGWEEFARLTRAHIRARLISRLPEEGGEGSLNLEAAKFSRLFKSNLRGVGLRGLFEQIPALSRVLCPCMLMSPITVAQYLQPQADAFDLVIFDEASQMSTAEAIGSIARAKAAIVVGDPKQLPPTAFFHSAYVDEENLENEDLESVLDDCLALGMPERHLLWHYRSRHESLIAFSNSMYYGNRLCTFPSPDGLESKVQLIPVDGVYDRGFTKRNRKEAEALVKEVVRRLSDPVLSRSSMGVVTFSSAQQEDIERLLSKEIAAKHLESAAYEREEPIFVKNLENVQGDERDVILFSVCYGPDKLGRVSLNFGPLNQSGGWRRLNVAVSRAREQMLIFSTMTSAMIDLAKTSSKGVAGLKAFLEFAEKGRTTLAVKSASVRSGTGLGKYIAAELEGYGYECRYDVGASDFKVDVAVLDPRGKRRFVLGILCDGDNGFSVKDRNILQMQSLKRGNWNVMRVNSVNYYNNPKREVKRIKDVLDRLTGAERKAGMWLNKYKKAYRYVRSEGAETAAFVTGGEHDGEIMARLREIVSLEEPISRSFLIKRCLQTFGIGKSGSRVESKLGALIDGCGFSREKCCGTEYFYKTPRAVSLTRVRVEEGEPLRRAEEDFTVFETVTLIRGALEDRVALYLDELTALVTEVYKAQRSGGMPAFVRTCVQYGEEKGIFVRSVSDRVSLA